MGSSHCFPCLEASFWTSESMASRIAGSGTMLDSYLEPPSFTEESRWPHQGQSRKTCPALSGKQSTRSVEERNVHDRQVIEMCEEFVTINAHFVDVPLKF